MPERIQRKRIKGWRMPTGAVYVGRGSKWGNPFKAGAWTAATGPNAGQKAGAAEVVSLYRHNLTEEGKRLARGELAGRDLACWCPLDQPCHADVLIEVANREGMWRRVYEANGGDGRG